MARHSLGGLRSLETIEAPDRTVTRLSPIQTWILRRVLEDPAAFISIPPQSNVRLAAKRLALRRLVDLRGDLVRYRPMATDGRPGRGTLDDSSIVVELIKGSQRSRPCE